MVGSPFWKMLYDQALLTIAYTEAYQATGNAEYKRTAEEIIEYVLRDITSPEGGFILPKMPTARVKKENIMCGQIKNYLMYLERMILSFSQKFLMWKMMAIIMKNLRNILP